MHTTSGSNAIIPASRLAIQRAATPILSDFPVKRQSLYRLSDSALKNGLHLVAGPGAGKSRLLGRIVVWQGLTRHKPQVILDPIGGVIDNLLDKIVRLPIELQRQLWPHLVYVDVGATDFVVPSPLYYPVSPQDTAFAVANRFPGLIKRLDPDLASAPILGWNSLYECSIYAGQIAAVLGRQIDFVADLIAHPRTYKEELKGALAIAPELQPAVEYFRELMDPTSGELRNRRTGSFVNKLLPFLSDPTMQAAFAAPFRGVDWSQVVQQGQTVLIDFRHELDAERRRFKLMYWFRDFIECVKQRGMTGRGQEILFVIDEVTQLLGQRTMNGQSILAEDLEELVAVLARNMGVNVVIAHQNLSQVEERVVNILMQMGTQIIGIISNPDDALLLARQLVLYNPYLVKKEEPVWMGLSTPSLFGSSYTEPTVIDYTTTEFTPDEQQLIASTKFQQLKRFQFLVRGAESEGNIAGQLRKISIQRVDVEQYPDTNQLSQMRAFLRQKCGVPIETLLAEIRSRQGAALQEGSKQMRVKSSPQLAILKSEEESTYATRNPVSKDTTIANPATGSTDTAVPITQGSRRDDGFWQ